MKRFLLTASAVAGAMALAGCSMLNKPSDELMKQCLIVKNVGGAHDIPLQALADWAEAHKANLRWEHIRASDFTASFRPADAPPEADSEIALDLSYNDYPTNKPNCGPGSMFITKVRVNGEALDYDGTKALTDRLIAILGEHIAGRSSTPQPTAAPNPAPTAPEAAANEDEEAMAEYASESEYYAQRATEAAKRSLSLADRDDNRFFGWTVERLLERLTAHGAKGRIDTADNGTVWVTVDDPTRHWNGWATIEFEMRPTPAMANGLIITSIKADDQTVASINGTDPTPADLLKPILPLR